MSLADDARRALVETHLRAAGANNDARARLALELAKTGMPLVDAVREAARTRNEDAYARYVQLANASADAEKAAPADARPTPIRIVHPDYPAELQAEGTSGEVTVAFVVTPEGRVTNVDVVSTTHEAFRQPAIDALRQWIFTPGIKNGRPVNTRMVVPLRFSPRN
jgi:protein TonB